MPRPSKRAKGSDQTAQPSSSAQVIYQTITDLPSELLLEIVSHFPTILIDEIIANPRILPVAYRERFASLRALSQTCKELREVCLPLAWERLEACTTAGDRQDMFFKEVGNNLERKCNGLMQNKHLLPYVRTVTVSLTRYKTSTILPAFANCLAVFPNLHTIQVVHAHSQMTTAIKTAFEGHTFPSVRTIIVPSCAHEILRRCPGVEDLTCNEDDGSKLIGALAWAKCGNLKTLRGISPNKAQAKRLGRIAPNLRLIQVRGAHYGAVGPGFIADFANSLQNLSTIEIKFVPDICIEPLAMVLQSRKTQYVEDARGILGSSKCDGEKLIRLRYTHWEGSNEFRLIREYKLEEVVVV
ncbi:hypothetical protein PILCRDRAFT_829424 [Piloderma croceum F 1598]|uniref:F-box domain-containing protein n=1 Tax=Piloderma croceum (strain F 1598) TaxID=765440 RepID=A0A0C3EYL1_PILCF|nr:hypothetical protein PILCRDRAFT_829424 [Piloderma croceum F 1598]